MTNYDHWSHTAYISERRGTCIQRWELDAYSDDEKFNYDKVVADIAELVGNTRDLTIVGIEVRREDQATAEQIAEEKARVGQSRAMESAHMVQRLRERHGDDPSQWPGM